MGAAMNMLAKTMTHRGNRDRHDHLEQGKPRDRRAFMG